ncbi:MAG: ATP-binding protein [Clostridiales bacterium]|nr:ATP-binding protein [Clostridiales bacterium]MDY6117071.1 ATP-binding protein [Anaerovoracaceae bacterium]
MKKRFFFSIMGVSMISLILCIVGLYFVLLEHINKIQENELTAQSDLIASQLEMIKDDSIFSEGNSNNSDDAVYLLKHLNYRDYRVTLVANDGTVLFDNKENPSEMKNHQNREEIKEARELGYGESTRYSSTMTEKYVYAARRLSDDNILRVSSSYETVLGFMNGMKLAFLGCFIIIALLSFYLAYSLSKYILKPINNIDLDDPGSAEKLLGKGGYEELSPLFRKIDAQKRDIANKEHQLVRRQEEFNAITANMSDGLIILDKQNRIISMNQAAIEAILTQKEDEDSGYAATDFDPDATAISRKFIGKNIMEFTRNTDILNGIIAYDSSVSELNNPGDSESLIISGHDYNYNKVANFGEKTYQISMSPIFTNGMPSGMEEHGDFTKEWRGTVLFLFDVTKKAEGELMRREFTANVSHELKTPLQSIYASAELLKTGLVPESDREEFVDRIFKESKRMIQLVQDIIELSELDEENVTSQKEEVNLYDVACSSSEHLAQKAKDLNVSVNVELDKIDASEAVIHSIPTLVHEIIYNLLDNAIKYNKESGTVSVRISQNPKRKIAVSVVDTGMGIEEKYLDRIFERFFRVDKSHSREIGGTGLGLSIVKHAAKVIGAELEVRSEVGEGTSVDVIFAE